MALFTLYTCYIHIVVAYFCVVDILCFVLGKGPKSHHLAGKREGLLILDTLLL
jgi:hypothetical protein